MPATTKTRSTTPGGGKSTSELVRQSNRWRDNYNAMRGLVVARAVTLIEAAARGDYAELELLLEQIEIRFPVMKALKSRRLAAMEKLDWNIKIMDPLPPGITDAQAEAQKNHLRSRYDLIENLTDTFGQLVLAEFRGFTILQKHRFTEGENDGAVREFHWLPQYNWSRDGKFGDWYYNQDSTFGVGGANCGSLLGEANRIGGDALPREDFIVREHDTPLYVIGLLAFINWTMGRKDWSAFVEIFGLPSSIIIMPPSIPTGKEDEYLVAAEKVAGGVSGALPNGSDAKFPTAGVRSQAPFKEFCDANVEDVVLAGTGGLLTMLSMPTGIGQGASGEHGDAFQEIAEADARRISATLQTDFDRVEINQAFPGQRVAVYFELAAEEEQDVTEAITQIATLRGAGYPVARETVEEKTGYELEEPGQGTGIPPALQQQRQTAAENQSPNPDAQDQELIENRKILNTDPQLAIAQSIAADLAPVLAALDERLARIVEIRDPALRKQKFNEAWAELEPLMKDIKADPATAKTIEKITAPALVQGLTQKS